jgi:hypothetical protein
MKFFVIGFLLCFGAVGGIGFLPPTATITEYIALTGAILVGLAFMVLGVLDIQEE